MKKPLSYFMGFLVFVLMAVLLLPDMATAQPKSSMHINFSTWHPPMSRERNNFV